uniref:Putative ovule protein n=1 Tax=Solanum chacoense TaxID=4108 RepID=A0A0V0GR08_SOLCH
MYKFARMGNPHRIVLDCSHTGNLQLISSKQEAHCQKSCCFGYPRLQVGEHPQVLKELNRKD